MTVSGHVDLLSRMEGLLTDHGFQSELAQVRSKATLRAVGEPEPPPQLLDLCRTSLFPQFSSFSLRSRKSCLRES